MAGNKNSPEKEPGVTPSKPPVVPGRGPDPVKPSEPPQVTPPPPPAQPSQEPPSIIPPSG